MTDDTTSPSLEAPLPPPRLTRRFMALIAGSVLVHAGIFAYAARDSHLYEERHPVVEVLRFEATTTVDEDGEPTTTWTNEGGIHRARITLPEM